MRELHELLRHYAGSEQRYKDFVQSMRNSTLTAFYTPPAIVRALAEALRDAGVVPRRLLDPSAGAGIFPSSFRETADGEVEILSFEKDLLTGQVLSALAREREQVVIDGFQTIESAYDSYFDVVTSNIPFGDTRIFDASFGRATTRFDGKRSRPFTTISSSRVWIRSAKAAFWRSSPRRASWTLPATNPSAAI